MIVWLLLDTKYVIEGDALKICSGPFRWTVPLADIVEVNPTDDPFSSPTLSLDRISIKYRRGVELHEILVSPEEREAFLGALQG